MGPESVESCWSLHNTYATSAPMGTSANRYASSQGSQLGKAADRLLLPSSLLGCKWEGGTAEEAGEGGEARGD